MLYTITSMIPTYIHLHHLNKKALHLLGVNRTQTFQFHLNILKVNKIKNSLKIIANWNFLNLQ